MRELYGVDVLRAGGLPGYGSGVGLVLGLGCLGFMVYGLGVWLRALRV